MAQKQKLDHKCIVCGTMYESCDNCKQIKSYTPWRSLCDSWDHYQIYLLIRTFQEGLDTKENLQAQLKKLGVTSGSYANWPEGTKKLLNQIFETPKKKKSVKVETIMQDEYPVIEESDFPEY